MAKKVKKSSDVLGGFFLKFESFYFISSSNFCVNVSYGYAPSTVEYFPVFTLRISVPGVPLRLNPSASAVCDANCARVSLLSIQACHFFESSQAAFAASGRRATA